MHRRARPPTAFQYCAFFQKSEMLLRTSAGPHAVWAHFRLGPSLQRQSCFVGIHFSALFEAQSMKWCIQDQVFCECVYRVLERANTGEMGNRKHLFKHIFLNKIYRFNLHMHVFSSGKSITFLCYRYVHFFWEWQGDSKIYPCLQIKCQNQSQLISF